MEKTKQLNELFECWKLRYPAELRDGFHADGIVDEPTWNKQSRHVAFVLAEPNSTEGRYARYRGQDLRPVFGQWKWAKAINRNVARWARFLLDGVEVSAQMSGTEADATNRRIAIMNLKKLSGRGTADRSAIAIAAWDAREELQHQIRIIDADVLIACGDFVASVLHRVLLGDPFAKVPRVWWTFGRVVVLHSHHPSLRNQRQEASSMARLADAFRQAGLKTASVRD